MKSIATVKKHLLFHLTSPNLAAVPALVGLTGIGKTAIVKQVAEELNAELIYFNMAQLSEGEMALPVPVNTSHDDFVKYAINHKLKETFDNPDKDYIVMVDEFTRGTIPVISEWMTIINERQLQGQHFSDKVRFVSAMNPTTSMADFHDTEYASSEMDDAHANRFIFMHVEANVNDWLDWAKGGGNVHPLVINFLEESNNRRFFYGKEADGIRMRTPRSWDYLSQSLHHAESMNLLKDQGFLYQLVGDHIGHDLAQGFTAFATEFLASIDYEDVLIEKPLKRDQIARFKKNPDSVKKSLLNGYIDRIKEEAPDMGPIAAKNYLALWDSLESIDNKYAITVELANALFGVKGMNTDKEQRYYEYQLHFENEDENKPTAYNKFILKYYDSYQKVHQG